MNNTNKALLHQMAEAKFGIIHPCSRLSFDECYTIEFNMLRFWFNSLDDSTHVVEINLN
jgi:hypothetical protein